MRKAGTTARHKCSLDCLWKETQHFCIWRAAKAEKLGRRNWVNAEITKSHLANSWSKLKNTRGFFFIFSFLSFSSFKDEGMSVRANGKEKEGKKKGESMCEQGRMLVALLCQQWSCSEYLLLPWPAHPASSSPKKFTWLMGFTKDLLWAHTNKTEHR